MAAKTVLKKWGNSFAVIIPREIVNEKNLTENDEVSVEINTKPTDFNGKKAEIAIIKTIKSKKEEK